MSNLFFQLGPKHSRLHQFEDFEKKFRSGKLSKAFSPIYDYRNRDLRRNRITSTVNSILPKSISWFSAFGYFLEAMIHLLIKLFSILRIISQ